MQQPCVIITLQCTESGVAIAPRPSLFRKELEVDELEVRV